VTRRWVESVARSAEIASSDDLTYRQLLDHLPELLRELGGILKRPDVPAIREQAARDASAHGHKRWQQGFRLAELIREICLLRNDVLDVWLDAFAAENAAFEGEARNIAARMVRRFFDDVIIDSTAQFAEEQREEIHTVQAALLTAEGSAEAAKSDLLRHVSHTLREPLGAIALAAAALEGDPGLSTGAKDYIRIILRNVKVEAANVEELLLASGLDVGAKKTTDLAGAGEK
jgi:signal transduction histidine kinase